MVGFRHPEVRLLSAGVGLFVKSEGATEPLDARTVVVRNLLADAFLCGNQFSLPRQ